MASLDTGAALGAAALVLTVTSTMAGHCPALAELVAADPDRDHDTARRLRHGELAAVVTSVAAGTLASVLTRSLVPLVAVAVGLGATAVVYEAALAAQLSGLSAARQ